jgi:hypothetical protein
MNRFVVYFFLGFAMGCPGEAGQDAGPVTDPGNDSEDAGISPEDAGATLDAGPPGPDGANDGGSETTDSGMLPVKDGGIPPSEDGGPGPGDCEPVDPCSGVALDPDSPTFNANGSTPSLQTPGGQVSIGTSDRSDVEAVLGAGVSVEGNEFRVNYCSDGVRIDYVAHVNNGVFADGSSQSDRVARIVTLPNSNVVTNANISIGDSRAAALSATTGVPTTYESGSATFDFYGALGLQFVSSGGGVTRLVLFKPQAVDGWGNSVDLLNGSLASLTNASDTLVLDSDDFGDVSDFFGDNFDAEGIYEVQEGIVTVKIWIRIYAAFGLRFAGVCSLFGSCDPNTDISSIVISDPFAGVDDNGLGLGSTRQDIEAEIGSGSEEEPGFYVYDSQKDLGVYYMESANCEETAASFVLNYVSN